MDIVPADGIQLTILKIYENEHKYSYLKKIFDSNNEKFNLIKVKIFEIDYKEFDKLKNKNL